ncbi:S8 family serine peptidase [Bacillus haynesii]|uniref:S8 family serine peptidase n=1 Tax=Bacillus haynesii TaxID=1925021 RepID=UPI002280B1DA|nr:S8 family serine peptidase [Bacillus haynesii]MCY8068065.1 S8 family serine peptidase [Bacillus haynesii]MCY9336963.1 S8 family serine peptidase [Bacillus haynesii]MCY9446886.1 S8 family serine peptidase [Bacillus haynesii]
MPMRLKNKAILAFITLFFLLIIFCLIDSKENLKTIEPSRDTGTIESIHFPLNTTSKRNMVKIAILDVKPSDKGEEYIDQINFMKKNTYEINKKTHSDDIASIIRKYSPVSSKVDLFVVSDKMQAISNELVIQALEQIITKDYDIINMSFYLKESNQKINFLIKELYRKNVVCVASVGNQGLRKNNYPSNLQEVISVGAIDETGEKWTESNYGSTDFVMPYKMESFIDGTEIEGTSVSSALMTAYIAHLKNAKEYNSNEDLYRLLISNTNNNIYNSSTGYGQPSLKKQ